MDNENPIVSRLRRAITEVFLIVVGVSIALAGDTWLADRAETVRTDLLLDSLEIEWTAELEHLKAYLERTDRAIAGVRKTILANKDGQLQISAAEAGTILMQSYSWQTYKPSEGALNTLMQDGLQNIDEVPLRMAIASWRAVLAELDAEQAALRELGTIAGPRIASKIAQRSGEGYSGNLQDSDAVMGMELGAFALAAFSDDEWVAHQRHLLNLLSRYRRQVDSVRDTLEQNGNGLGHYQVSTAALGRNLPPRRFGLEWLLLTVCGRWLFDPQVSRRRC